MAIRPGQIVRDPPLRVRLIWEGLREAGFLVAENPKWIGGYVHIEAQSPVKSALPKNERDIAALMVGLLRSKGMIIKAEQIRVEPVGSKFVVPIRISDEVKDEAFQRSDDYSSIEFEGTRYSLTDSAARIVRVMYEAYLSGDPWVSATTIREKTRMNQTQRIDHAFRERDGQAFRKELVLSRTATRQYRLKLPDRI